MSRTINAAVSFGVVWLLSLAVGCQSATPNSGTGGGAFCGNGICEGSEATTCPGDCKAGCSAPCAAPVCTGAGEIQDCITNSDGCKALAAPKACANGGTCTSGTCSGGSTVATCGNGACEAGESSSSCAKDCPASGAVCGNAKCETGESSASCASDCPANSGHFCDNSCGMQGATCSCDSECRARGDCCDVNGNIGANPYNCGGSTCGKCAITTGYLWVTLDGNPEPTPDCNSTSSPGADIDLIALYAASGQLKGVGKPGSAVWQAAASPGCATWGSKGQCAYGAAKAGCYNNPNDITGKLDTKMYSDGTPDTGYFALGRGRVRAFIGACSVTTDDVKQCDGKGGLVEIMVGDELDVYEVDGSYKSGGSSASGIAPANCICKAESYELFVSVKPNVNLMPMGTYSGSKGQIKVN